MRIKNLFNTGKMNKDVDERLIPNGEYIDASNIRVLNTTGSDAGAIENEKGNVQVTNINISNNPECIGSVSDESDEKIYWFVVNDDGFSYIYEYDRRNNITTQILADERTGNQQVLGFSKDYKITGVNVFYNIPKKEKLLVFTDNLNQPRCVNIKRASGYGLNNFEEDDINLYKKPPYEAPKVIPTNSLQVDENSVKERFFAFAYRYKYLDGEFSALSSFSNYQFVPGPFDLDYSTLINNGMVNIFNSYQVKYNTGDKRVTDIQICFKTSNDNNVYVAESINKKESSLADNTTKTFVFTNKKIYKQLPPDEITRIFDNVPLKAQAQDIIEDRILFGNYTVQYDLKENELDDNFLKVDYSTTVNSLTQSGESIDTTFPSTTEITLDLSNINLVEGHTFFFNPSIESATAGTSPNNYHGGSFDGTSAVVLSQTYTTVYDFSRSDDLFNLLSAITNNFEDLVDTTPNQDTVSTQFGQFEVSSTTSTSITIKAPSILYTIDTTPNDPNDGNAYIETEVFTYVQANTVVALKEKTANSSLKTLKSYEVGLVYLDKYGRYSSIIPSVIHSEKSNEVFVPVEKSILLNSLRVEVSSKPPYWADRYKFFVKASKSEHYNIYATVFYEENLFRWVLLEGGNLGKVESGDYLVVKSDDNGPLSREVKVKVLDIVTKNASDDTSTDATEGWIEGNGVKELAGTYMKIKPVGFTMDYNPYNFQNYNATKVVRSFVPGTTVQEKLPKDSEVSSRGLAMYYENNQWNYLDIAPGSRIKLKFEYYEYFDSDRNDYRFYEKEFVVGGNYVTDANGSAFEKWFDAETEWYYDAQNNKWLEPKNQFEIRFVDTGTFAGGDFVQQILFNGFNVYKNYLDGATLIGDINIQLSNGLTIFETIQKEDDGDIFYETEQTFKIENGLHKGNNQDQTSSLPAICDLNYYSCFSYDNGAESVNIYDDRFTYRLGGDYRPNIVLQQGYKELNVTHGLIHSGSYNENSGYNALNEFNSSRGITKNLDTKYGSIQKLFSRERDMIVFQEDRVSKILYGKTILTSPDGTGSLSQVESVLGQDIPYPGEYGISTDPASFSQYEGKLYFADSNRGAVLSLAQDSILPISYQGMKSFFKQELFNNKDNWNIGGFDPKFHQYVLTMSDKQKPRESLQFNCGSTFIRTITSALDYKLQLGDLKGTAAISYTTSNSIDIVVVYNGNTYTNNSLTGSGQITFPVSESDINTTNIADVTITPSYSSEIVISHSCPQPDTLDVVLVVVNDSEKAGQNIINRYKHDGSDIYNSDLDVFDVDEVSRYEVVSGFEGTDIIPENGDVVTISSLRQIGIHTASFNNCNSLGYLVSDAAELSVQDILNQATYPTVSSSNPTSGEEENSVSFTFNRNNTNEKLYLIWNYIDTLPVLVDDYLYGMSDGATSTINVLSNETIPSPYTVSIGRPPQNGVAVVNNDNTITYTHNSGSSLNDSFTYVVDRGGTCSAEALVTVEPMAINPDTYIYLYLDESGSMIQTKADLETMKAQSLKSVLQDYYATGETEANGNTDTATNGSDRYDSRVNILVNPSYSWTNERTLAALSDNDVNDFLSTSTHNDFPSDARNVIVMVFQDESTPYGADSTTLTTPPATSTTEFNTDVADLRSRVLSLNSSNSGFYRGAVFQIVRSPQFKGFLEYVEQGIGMYGLISDLFTSPTKYFDFQYDVEDSDGNDLNAPLKPSSTTDRFDQWQYYYTYQVTDTLNKFGLTPSGAAWPIIIDD